MLKRFAVSWDAERGFHIELPSYRMVTGTWAPVTNGLIHADGVVPGAKVAAVMALNPSVEVELPGDTPTTKAGELDAVAMRVMYADHPKYGHRNFAPPAEVAMVDAEATLPGVKGAK